MEESRYVFKCQVWDTETDTEVAIGSVDLPNEVRGDPNGFAVDSPDEWTEDRAESTFWDTMRAFRRAQKKVETEDEVEEDETA